MFHKRSTNVPTSNRNEPKCLSFNSRICPIERDHVYLVQENRFWTKSKQSVLNKTNSNSETIPKRFGFISKTMSGCLSFRFDIINLICRSISIYRFRTKKLADFLCIGVVGCGCCRNLVSCLCTVRMDPNSSSCSR
jgi:hypothetical protein